MSLLTQFYSGGSSSTAGTYTGSLAGPSPSYAFYECPDLGWGTGIFGGSGTGASTGFTYGGSYNVFGQVYQQSGGSYLGYPGGSIQPNGSNPTGQIKTTARVMAFSGVIFSLSGGGTSFNIALPRAEEIYNWTWFPLAPVVLTGTQMPSLKKLSGLGLNMYQASTFKIQNVSTLTTVEAPKFYWTASPANTNMIIEISGCALSATSVNDILVAVDTGYPSGATSYTGSSLNLSGGTSAGTSALTTAGINARNSLIAKGWTVTLNA